MSHIDKKNNQESKKVGKKTKKELDRMKVETANEIGVFKESNK
ncbi:small, acid-soluble spore protein, alpha/beta type [Clostridium algoriphilum]|nr:small, acid-soluble spore protein, alpha/beta type [Clostridium algoriphilum]MCB2294802.1 small, acid-soluble spore protein, alpha/beta type [Clostridium algoriphilum]